MAKKTKALPKTVFVRRVDEGTDDEYLSCDIDAADLAETGQIVIVGKYQLVEWAEVDATPRVIVSKTRSA